MMKFLYDLAVLHGIQYDMVELGIGFLAGVLVQGAIFRRRVSQLIKLDRMYLEAGNEIVKQQEKREGIFTRTTK